MEKLRQICPLYELLSMNKDFGSKKYMREIIFVNKT